MINWPALIVFASLFGFVTILGFAAERWRRADLGSLHEWALAGRRFGTLVSWFLIGGDLYTAYTFIALPALVYGVGGGAFWTLPYTALVYPIVFIFAPRFWTIAKKRGYITYADFTRDRFDSRLLALAIAVTGIIATMPYIALQLVGLRAVIQETGLSGDWPIIIAFAILAAYTYRGGLRAPALVAFVKDALIYTAIIAAAIVIPAKLGGYGHIFAVASDALAHRAKAASLIITPPGYFSYTTLALGSAMALFMYPHAITSVLSASGPNVVRRNMALLPAYSILLGLMALLGYMAIVAGLHPTDLNLVAPQLYLKMFPAWFAGVAFAAIGIGALVPAAIMSIAAANLFTRNIYREYFKPDCTPRHESGTAKLVSLIVKAGALAFVLLLPTQYAINLQLLAGSWIIQTFPTVVIGLYSRWLHRAALLWGWLAGMTTATLMWAAVGFKTTVFPLHIGGTTVPGFIAVYGLAANLIVSVALTIVLDTTGVARGTDRTAAPDYEEEPEVGPVRPEVAAEAPL